MRDNLEWHLYIHFQNDCATLPHALFFREQSMRHHRQDRALGSPTPQSLEASKKTGCGCRGSTMIQFPSNELQGALRLREMIPQATGCRGVFSACSGTSFFLLLGSNIWPKQCDKKKVSFWVTVSGCISPWQGREMITLCPQSASRERRRLVASSYSFYSVWDLSPWT